MMPTEPPTSTPTQIPTETATPTVTFTPTATSSPTPKPATVAQLMALLQKNDFDCSRFTSINEYVDLRPNIKGYSCYKDNVYETIKYYPDGYVRLEVLNDPKSRVEKMEKKFKLLDELFPADFMAQLREANAAYDETAPRSVSGVSAHVWLPAPEDWWQSLEAQYNVSSTTIGTQTVTFPCGSGRLNARRTIFVEYHHSPAKSSLAKILWYGTTSSSGSLHNDVR